ncbi:hypothetical protein SUGI_0406840 [Cryptomeria japonica]|nr:hypothetical protein SUGI_0406840 [Cryptomeria japonica]
MEGSDSGEGSGKRNGYVGVKRRHSHSGKISKVVKRTVIQPPKQNTPLYTIHKNDFRTIVQRLTGSPTAPPPPPPPPPPLLQRPRFPPPPPESVFSFNKLVCNSNLAAMKSVSFPSYQQQQVAADPSATGGAATFDPFTATTCADLGYAFQFPSQDIYPPLQELGPRGLVSHMTVPSAFSAPIQFPHPAAAAAMAAQQGSPPLFLQSAAVNAHQFVSSGSEFAVSQLLAGSQVPFSPGSFMPLSPTEQFQFGQLPPPSPGSWFSLPTSF